ncbi:methyltransferase domain-containing protein [Anaerolineae bacterium CFX7]|nr:methyltransferase domain-containing protein [Anaerolineae bacterium CFX7]
MISAMHNLLPSFLQFLFHQLYTTFSFGYDTFSNIISRGEWWNWTRAAIPFVRGTRVLELALGSGSLHVDLYDAGYVPVGIDLSPYMLDLTRRKFRSRFPDGSAVPRLVRADAKQLPFPSEYFSSLVMTFPPGFAFDGAAMRELWRVLEPNGMVIWVDDPYLYARDTWSRILNSALNLSNVGANTGTEQVMQKLNAVDGGSLMRLFDWRVERVELARSRVHVFLATKRE